MNEETYSIVESSVRFLVEKYGFNKTLTIIGCSVSAFLIAFILAANLIPNDNINVEKEI